MKNLKLSISDFFYRLYRAYLFFNDLKRVNMAIQKSDAVKKNIINDFVSEMAAVTKIGCDELFSNTTRKREYVEPRQILMVIFHYSIGITQEEVEDMFHRQHPAVIHSKKKVNEFLIYKDYREKYKDILLKAFRMNERFADKVNVKKLL